MRVFWRSYGTRMCDGRVPILTVSLHPRAETAGATRALGSPVEAHGALATFHRRRIGFRIGVA